MTDPRDKEKMKAAEAYSNNGAYLDGHSLVAFMAGWEAKASRDEIRIEALEKEVIEQARLNGMGSEREATLVTGPDGINSLRHRITMYLKMLESAEDKIEKARIYLVQIEDLAPINERECRVIARQALAELDEGER